MLGYSTCLDGSKVDAGAGIAVDSSGNADVTGWTYSTDLPTVNPFERVYVGPAWESDLSYARCLSGRRASSIWMRLAVTGAYAQQKCSNSAAARRVMLRRAGAAFEQDSGGPILRTGRLIGG